MNQRINAIPRTLQSTISDLWQSLTYDSKLDAILARIRKIFHKSNHFMEIDDNLEIEKKVTAQVVLIRPNGKVLLFDIDKKLVYIKLGNSKVMHYNKLMQSAEMWGYSIMKKEIGKYFNIPKNKESIGCFDCEDLIEGRTFSHLNLSERLKVIKDICISSKKISENSQLSSTVSGFEIINEGFTLALLNVKQRNMLEYIKSRKEIIIEYSKNWKMIPSHCDITSHNITISNGHPVLFDLAPHKLGFVPSFFVPMCLMHSEAKEYGRFDLVNAYLNRELNTEINPLFGNEMNNFNRNNYIDLFLAETLTLAAIDSKIMPQNIQYWFEPIFELL